MHFVLLKPLFHHLELQCILFSVVLHLYMSNWIVYLIDNVYTKIGNKVYRQTFGIPMGTDCAFQLPNLFLFHYEYSYMKKLMKDNRGVAKMLSDTMRYIDDLLTLNNATFDAVIGEIYPELS